MTAFRAWLLRVLLYGSSTRQRETDHDPLPRQRVTRDGVEPLRHGRELSGREVRRLLRRGR